MHSEKSQKPSAESNVPDNDEEVILYGTTPEESRRFWESVKNDPSLNAVFNDETLYKEVGEYIEHRPITIIMRSIDDLVCDLMEDYTQSINKNKFIRGFLLDSIVAMLQTYERKCVERRDLC